MKDVRFQLIKDHKIVGYEHHKLLDNPMVKKSIYIYHSRTGHDLSWYEITISPEEYIIHDSKIEFTNSFNFIVGEKEKK